MGLDVSDFISRVLQQLQQESITYSPERDLQVSRIFANELEDLDQDLVTSRFLHAASIEQISRECHLPFSRVYVILQRVVVQMRRGAR
jgi:DNA-directed RNA polymerase specialized sigma24 family protein